MDNREVYFGPVILMRLDAMAVLRAGRLRARDSRIYMKRLSIQNFLAEKSTTGSLQYHQ